MSPSTSRPLSSMTAAVIGGGPAGLMAAQQLATAGIQVDLYDAMPSVGRKFLMAGKSGMNLTHAEPAERFLARYGQRQPQLAPMIAAFDPSAQRAWVHSLGIDTFVGSSGRVFPTGMKAAPMLRAWLHALRGNGVRFHMRHRWLGWDEPASGDALPPLHFATREGTAVAHADAVVLALGGASWARLGSDGAWVPWLQRQGIAVAPLRPANCGFDVAWTAHFRERFAGTPVKTVSIAIDGIDGATHARQGEFVITEDGIEGSLVYALSAPIRDRLDATGEATVRLDLLPDMPAERVADDVSRPRGARSLSSHLQSRLGIAGVKAGLLRECLAKSSMSDPAALAHALKALPLRLERARPIDEVISSAGGVAFESLDSQLMAKALPGVFFAGEMLDWEAPTGGYLLTACFATGRAAGLGAAAWLSLRAPHGS